MESGKSSEIRSIDLDGSDNLSEGIIKKFIDQHHVKLEGLVLTGMGQISDMLFITELPKTKVERVNFTDFIFHHKLNRVNDMSFESNALKQHHLISFIKIKQLHQE